MTSERTALQPLTERPATEVSFEALYELLARLAAQPTLASALNEVLMASLDLVGADAGYIRLFDPREADLAKNPFRFVAQRGISDAFIAYFSSLADPVDPKAREEVFNGRRLVFEDMTTHPSFSAHRKVVLAEGYRSLHVTPLMSQNGSRCVGVIHSLFVERYSPPASVMDTLDLYAELAATAIDREQQLTALADRDAMLTAVLNKQVVTLKRLQEHVRKIDDSLDLGDIHLIARALSDELQHASVAAEMSTAELLAHNAAEATADLEANPYGLSSREMEAMAHVWRGLSDRQIALRMGISRFTVAKHVGSGMRKMNVETRTQASVLFEREALYERSPDG